MSFPAFFDEIPPITLIDPLAALLGAAEHGEITYTYADAVKLAGHSCPTVAGAWLMLCHGLKALYGEEKPVRGQIRISLAEGEHQGVAGVIASIATLLTGAAGPAGFKGLGGLHRRRNLLHFGVASVGGILQLERLDRSEPPGQVTCSLNLSIVPADPRMGQLLQEVLADTATDSQRQMFAALWQERVRRILTDHHDDPDVIRIS